MGNCMETCLPRISHQQAQADDLQDIQMDHTTTTTTTYSQKQISTRHVSSSADDEDEQVVISDEIGNKGDGGGGGGSTVRSVRVKIVVTKEELHWLMMQLKSDDGDHKRLENMLEEIGKGRKQVVSEYYGGGKKCVGWKPSLESIMETP